MYRVIEDFADLQDNGRIYHTGDIYPKNSAEISIDAERYAELSSSKNRRGTPVIEYVPEEPEKPSEDISEEKQVNNTDEVEKPRRKASGRKEK